MSAAEVLATAWCRKELGHVWLHSMYDTDAVVHRGVEEVEAESVALAIGATHGMPTDQYTIPYLSGLASSVRGSSPVEVVQATGERVRKAAVSILDRLETLQVSDGMPPEPERSAGQSQKHAPQRPRRSARTPSDPPPDGEQLRQSAVSPGQVEEPGL